MADLRRWGLAALALVASCTPHRPPATARAQAIPSAVRMLSDQRLLDGLALTVADGGVTPAPIRLDAPPAFDIAQAGVDGARRATDCLTAAVYYEARSEPIDGQRAVAQVVLNRVRDRAFPASVCGVVYQRSSRGCQFSFACDGATDHPIEPRAWALAAAIARAALNGAVFSPVGAATHYHTSAILPWWAPSLARIGAIGSHVFYRWGDRLRAALSFRQAYSGDERVTIASSVAALPVVHRGTDGTAEADPTVLAGGVAIHHGVAPEGVAQTGFGVRVHRGLTISGGDEAGVGDPASE